MNELSSNISRADFGEDFIFGGASSAYQNEGAAAKDGKGPSIWDTFTNQTPEKIIDGSNGNVAIDQYHRFKEDIQMMKKMGLDAYRFSISWPRILPGGRISGGVNKEGIKYYNNLINELLANGIQPFVTLFHWDVPQALEDEYGGFLSTNIVNDFIEYAELCFWEFGDRVKYWSTVNEPWSFAVGGYISGSFAPGRGFTPTSTSTSSSLSSPSSSSEHLKDDTALHRSCNYNPSNNNNNGGDPATEPYLVAHHLLLAHAQAVTLYREHFMNQGGKIGIVLVSQWWEPLHKTRNDDEAVERALDFMFGWFMEPISSGKYPKSMIDRVGSRLPKFTEEESANLKGSFDFIGLNYYTSSYVTDATHLNNNSTQPASYFSDQQTTTQVLGSDGKTPIGNKAGSSWLYIHPVGIYKLLRRIKTKYNDPLIFITENGVDEVNDNKLTVSEAREDPIRIKYHKDHLNYIEKAITIDKVNVKGYFIWSLFDNFEWDEGYSVRFGLIHVNYKDSYARYPKKSAIWFMNFLLEKKKKSINGGKNKILANKRGLDEDEHMDLSSTAQQNPKKKAIKN